MITKIYIENQLIDLFDDETIELNSSVANTEDISKVNTDYTKTFTVPASDRNNALFKHYYNADIDNTFDARTKKSARIELDGFPFRTGKIRLEKVTVKDGRASSYTINFWGNLVNFKTLIKDDLLSTLDLSAYDHIYSYTNVLEGLINNLYGGDIIYTLLSQRRQYMYNSDPGDNTNTDKLVNIAYNGEDRGVNWNELKPSIRIMAIIEAIEAKYGITFSRDFFDRNEFLQLYLWLSNTGRQNYTKQLINWTSGNATEYGLNLTTDTWTVTSYGALPPPTVQAIAYKIEIIPATGYEAVPYKIIAERNGLVSMSVDATGTFITEFITVDPPPFVFKFFVSSAATFVYEANLSLRIDTTINTIGRSAQTGTSTITDNFEVSQAMPDMKIIDFLKGLFNMFKLVAIPDDQNNVYVNNIDDYYREGTVRDITKWVNTEKYDVERGKIFNVMSFKYQEPTTILNMQFKKNEGYAYGDVTLPLADDDGVPLDGDPLEITLPFEQVVYERLRNQFTNVNTSVQYGLITNDSIEPANPKALIFYNNRVSLATSPISLLNGSGFTVFIDNIVNTSSHSLSLDNPQFTVLWGKELSTWNGAEMTNTLYQRFWSGYIASIFNVKKRNFKFSAKLPTYLLTQMALNDILFIEDRYYRINDFTVDLTTGKSTLNLMNTFENNFGLFVPSQYTVQLSSIAQTYGVYVSNGSVMNVVKQDIGFDTDWATITQSGFNLMITVTANGTAADRAMFINVDNGAGKSFQIYLNQRG